jgi:hypothetical protein
LSPSAPQSLRQFGERQIHGPSGLGGAKEDDGLQDAFSGGIPPAFFGQMTGSQSFGSGAMTVMKLLGIFLLKQSKISWALPSVLVITAAGCQLCCPPYMDDYATVGGKWNRADPTTGRVGSAFSDPGVSDGHLVHHGQVYDQGYTVIHPEHLDGGWDIPESTIRSWQVVPDGVPGELNEPALDLEAYRRDQAGQMIILGR